MLDKMLSKKQQEFLLAIDRRINVLSGSVRSGKTYISLLKFALTIAESPAHYEFLMVGKTITALKRNCLGLLQDLIGDNIKYSLSQKQGEIFGHKVYFEGANDERAESKIRGMTLGGSYVDELTQIPEDFYKMLLSRLSLPGAKLYATTNPDNPMHYVKTDIIDNEKIDVVNWHFVIDDNIFLDPEYVKQIKAEYDGVFYDRLILGRWVIAEGLVYSNFNAVLHTAKTEPRNYTKYQVSIDYGTFNPFCGLLWGLSNGVWYCVKEYWHNGRDSQKGQKDDGQYYDDLLKFIGNIKIDRMLVDPSASSFITHARHRGNFDVIHAKNDVLDGIRSTQTALNKGLIKINDCCKNLIREFGLYSWNEKAEQDEPIKENDHAMDACRYFVFTNYIAIPKKDR